ncbi:hypothetical protein C8R45DRAFT_1214281 [Mycena sanguinolenta]|nr:hypothetical protein C8R45DRAFT_1214281 [Mycena sanguinolenta]
MTARLAVPPSAASLAPSPCGPPFPVPPTSHVSPPTAPKTPGVPFTCRSLPPPARLAASSPVSARSQAPHAGFAHACRRRRPPVPLPFSLPPPPNLFTLLLYSLPRNAATKSPAQCALIFGGLTKPEACCVSMNDNLKESEQAFGHVTRYLYPVLVPPRPRRSQHGPLPSPPSDDDDPDGGPQPYQSRATPTARLGCASSRFPLPRSFVIKQCISHLALGFPNIFLLMLLRSPTSPSSAVKPPLQPRASMRLRCARR